MFGLFGDLFDYDHDGKMDGFEQAAEYAAVMSIMDEEKELNAQHEDDLFWDREDEWQ